MAEEYKVEVYMSLSMIIVTRDKNDKAVMISGMTDFGFTEEECKRLEERATKLAIEGVEDAKKDGMLGKFTFSENNVKEFIEGHEKLGVLNYAPPQQ